MTIGANYPTPVTVNGYSCKNCTEVDEAKKFIDPAHPKSGPFGIDAKSDPTVRSSPAFILSGNLAGSTASAPQAAFTTTPSDPRSTGNRVNVSA